MDAGGSMARTLREVNLATRTARDRLKPSGKPYFRALDEGLHLGYRKGMRGGTWVLRWYAGAETYKVESLDGRPDDVLDANGITVLFWTLAQTAARQLFQLRQREALGLETSQQTGPYTVRKAIADYLDWLERHRKTLRDTVYRVEASILPELGDIDTTRLTAARLRKWHEGVAAAPIRLRRNIKEKQRGEAKVREINSADPEAARRRRSTANRVLTILKAALNHAWREGKIVSDDAWRRVRPFPEADAARVRYLTTDDARRLLNACQPDFRTIVNGALLTGARYGELTALVVADFNSDSGTIHIRTSKSGKGRHMVLNHEGIALFQRQTAGRPGDARIFLKADGTAWGKSHQQRPFKEACQRAMIAPAITFHELRHTWASLSIMAGAPLMVVAQNLGHADTRMVEKHYGHLGQSYVAEMIRKTSPTFEIVDAGTIVRMQER
jgi:integrase